MAKRSERPLARVHIYPPYGLMNPIKPPRSPPVPPMHLSNVNLLTHNTLKECHGTAPP
jgi:hypothetical protein